MSSFPCAQTNTLTFRNCFCWGWNLSVHNERWGDLRVWWLMVDSECRWLYNTSAGALRKTRGGCRSDLQGLFPPLPTYYYYQFRVWLLHVLKPKHTGYWMSCSVCCWSSFSLGLVINTLWILFCSNVKHDETKIFRTLRLLWKEVIVLSDNSPFLTNKISLQSGESPATPCRYNHVVESACRGSKSRTNIFLWL